MAAKDELGRAGEERAAQYLRGEGYTVLDRNWRCDQGEIDIVAVRGPTLAVVEVKTRRSDAFGHPFEAIDARKSARLWALAGAWMRARAAACSSSTIGTEALHRPVSDQSASTQNRRGLLLRERR